MDSRSNQKAVASHAGPLEECAAEQRRRAAFKADQLEQERRQKARQARLRTVILVDYESWAVGLWERWGLHPNIQALFDQFRQTSNIVSAIFFADLSSKAFLNDLPKIRLFSSEIVDTRPVSVDSAKDFTDFIILDRLYRMAYNDLLLDRVVLVTGDGHFSQAVMTLRLDFGLEVVVYGVKNCVSTQLLRAASRTYIVPTASDCLLESCRKILRIMQLTLREKPDFVFYYASTVDFVAKRFPETDSNELGDALKRLMVEKYIAHRGGSGSSKQTKQLVIDWEKVYRDKLLDPNQIIEEPPPKTLALAAGSSGQASVSSERTADDSPRRKE